MSETKPFSYAVLQLVPCLKRGERLNVGVVLFCRQLGFLDLATALNRERLSAVAPDLDPEPILTQLEVIRRVITGDPATGRLGSMEPSERFGWLTAPSSTIIQPSAVHTGLTADPQAELDRLFQTLVL